MDAVASRGEGKGGKGFGVRGGGGCWVSLYYYLLILDLSRRAACFPGGFSVVFRSERVGEEEVLRGGILDKEI